MSEKTPFIFANDSDLTGQLRQAFGRKFQDGGACLVCVKGSETGKRAFGDLEDCVEVGTEVRRVLIVFVGRPIQLDAMGKWRAWAGGVNALEIRMDFVSDEPGIDEFKDILERHCASWFAEPVKPEEAAIRKGDWVSMPVERTPKDSPSLLTMMFGSMGELLTEVEVVARRFRGAVRNIDARKVETFLKKVDTCLAEGSGDAPELLDQAITDRLPKLLLRGDSGVGKTLITAYLHQRCGFKGRPLHVSIPEYLGKEDMFEYTLFGYAAGNYTGGKPNGDHGLLLENAGGVIFLDEIGEANATIQAKLLTFLDHYRVRPRGWLGAPFYCPVLVVAATNRDLEEMVEGKPVFRRDLLARFSDISRIPPLRERKQDFEFILDCLLQRESMNPGGRITSIGKKAFKFLKEKDFEEGNFRELEGLFRSACKRANRDGRTFLVISDFQADVLQESVK